METKFTPLEDLDVIYGEGDDDSNYLASSQMSDTIDHEAAVDPQLALHAQMIQLQRERNPQSLRPLRMGIDPCQRMVDFEETMGAEIRSDFFENGDEELFNSQIDFLLRSSRYATDKREKMRHVAYAIEWMTIAYERSHKENNKLLLKDLKYYAHGPVNDDFFIIVREGAELKVNINSFITLQKHCFFHGSETPPPDIICREIMEFLRIDLDKVEEIPKSGEKFKYKVPEIEKPINI